MMKMYNPQEVGNRLRTMREKRGYSRKKIAEGIGRTLKYYGDIERGSCGMSIETLLELADFYQVSLDYLVDGIVEGQDKIDERTKWIMRTMCHLEEPRKQALVDMVKLLVEQWNENSN